MCSWSNCTKTGVWKGFCPVHYQVNYRKEHRVERKAYRQVNKEKIDRQKKAWVSANIDKVQGYNSSPKRKFKSGRQNAHRRGLEWVLTFEQYKIFSLRVCHYCGGALPTRGCGLDRLDNSRGYFIDNVVACCEDCNYIKGDRLTPDEMTCVAKALIDYRNKNAA